MCVFSMSWSLLTSSAATASSCLKKLSKIKKHVLTELALISLRVKDHNISIFDLLLQLKYLLSFKSIDLTLNTRRIILINLCSPSKLRFLCSFRIILLSLGWAKRTLVGIKSLLILVDYLSSQRHNKRIYSFNTSVKSQHVETFHHKVLRVRLVIPAAKRQELESCREGA